MKNVEELWIILAPKDDANMFSSQVEGILKTRGFVTEKHVEEEERIYKIKEETSFSVALDILKAFEESGIFAPTRFIFEAEVDTDWDLDDVPNAVINVKRI